MAQKKRSNIDFTTNRRFKNLTKQVADILGQANLDLYGTDRTSQTEDLARSFQDIMNAEISSITGKGAEDNLSLLSILSSNDRKASAINDMLNNQFMTDNSAVSLFEGFIQDAYRNRLNEQSDLHEVASQLIELSEAILVTRDAIVSSDVVEGRIGRTIEFENVNENEKRDMTPIIEKMEAKFKLPEKIKSFVIPRTLEYGEYYAYTIPYSKIFKDFSQYLGSRGGPLMVRESAVTLLDFVNTSEASILSESAKDIIPRGKTKMGFSERVYAEYCRLIDMENAGRAQIENNFFDSSKPNKASFCRDLENILSRITVSNSPIPLPVLEEGEMTIQYVQESFFDESTGNMNDTPTEKEHTVHTESKFAQVIRSVSDNGVHFAGGKQNKNDPRTESFENFTDCYIKLISPLEMVPVKLINKVIGYYRIQAEDVTPLSGEISSNLYYSKFDETARQQTIIDAIANAIVASFNKKFLEKNEKFKEEIVEALQYYNLNNHKIRFQFIPVEYVQLFSIEEDENGNGTSMIKKSLFYAKLYLMLLLFKIMSIILNSNDTKVNYIKSSGIDKNLANKVQEIARIRQSRQINIYDLFNYTTLISKVGSGNEMYIPTGRSGERPIETEILSGQDVPLNTELLETLKNAYILGTGVPAAIINYLNEADFAKVVEQNNSKFMGRVINYQLDFNSSITEWYKKIMRSSTSIPPEYIENFRYTLRAPKTSNSNAKSEMINAFSTYSDFVTQLIYGDNSDGTISQEEILEFKQLLADDQMPMLNLPHLFTLREKAKLNATQQKLTPNSNNGDSGDDVGVDLNDVDL